MSKHYILLFILFLGLSKIVQSQDLEVAYFVDSSKGYTIDEVRQKTFLTKKTKILNLGSTNDVVWLKIKAPASANNQMLEIGLPIIDTVDIYRLVEDQFIPKRYGTHLSFSQLPLPDYSRMFVFDIAPNELVYIRIRSTFQIELPIRLASIDEITRRTSKSNFFFGIFFGSLLALFLYNLFITLIMKSKVYFYYLGYIFFSIIFYLSHTGYSFTFIHPHLPSLNYYSNALTNIGLFTVLAFCSQFLNLRYYSKKNVITIKILMAILIINTVLELLLGHSSITTFSIITQLLSLVISLYLIGLGVYLFFSKKQQQALIYVIAWGSYFIGIIMYVLTIGGTIPSNFITNHGIYIGAVTELILFSIALVLRINQFRKETEIARQNEIDQTMINQQIVKEQREKIERQVTQKTTALEGDIKKLNAECEKLNASLQSIADQSEEIKFIQDGITTNFNHLKCLRETLLDSDKKISVSNEHFIIHQPKEEIPKDFYWFTEQENKKFFTLGNSFGDGIPTSLLSLIAIDTLEKTVNTNLISNPSKILKVTNTLINEQLNQAESKLNNNLSISIVSFNKNERKIEMACAGATIYIVENNQVKTIKGDSFNIGKEKEDNQLDKNYTEYSYRPKENVCIYLASNDFSKKIDNEGINQLLLDIHSKPIKKQKEELLKAIEHIKLENSQLNDISILGIKY